MTPRTLGSAVAAVLMLAGLASAPSARAADDGPQWQHGLAMHGDLKYGPDFKHFDYVNPDAPKGGTLHQAAQGTFDTFNPYTIKGTPAAGLGNTDATLMTSSADEPFSEYGLIAEAVRTPKDRSWVEFRLRKQARFSDGKPITPEDVVWTFNTLTTKGSPSYRYYYAGVKDVRQTGERTVRFDFKPGLNRELPLILGQLPVLPKHYWADKKFDQTTLTPPVGSGPYRIADFEAGRHIAYERVKDWWGENLPEEKGLNNFGRIEYDYYRDSSVMIEALKAGQFDFRLENSSKDWATAYNVPAVKQGLLVKREIPNHRTAGMQGFVYNTRREVFKDPKVREALAYAFDFEWTNKNLFYGQYTRARSYFDNSELAATGLPSKAELKLLDPLKSELPPRVFTEAYNPPSAKGEGGLRHNLRQAMRLLREAGWVVKDGKLVDGKTGKPFRFEMLLVSPLFERVVLPFKRNLARLGIEMSVRTVDSAQYIERVRNFDFDMIVSGWGESLSPGNEQRGFWTSAAADQPGSQNYAGIKSKAIDSLVNDVIGADSRPGLVTAVHALDRALQWGFYVIPNWYIPYDRVVYWDKFGYPKVTPTRGFQLDAWWIDPEKAPRINQRQNNSQSK